MRKILWLALAITVLLCAACENAAAPSGTQNAADFSAVQAELAALPPNTADTPHPLALSGFDFSDGAVWRILCAVVGESGKYIALDLSACTGSGFVAGRVAINVPDLPGGEEYIVSVAFPEGIENLNVNLRGYAGLRSIRLPGSLVNMQSFFNNCPELETVSFPASVSTVDYRAFTGSPRVSFEVRGEGLMSSPAYPAAAGPAIPAGKLLVRNRVTLVLAAPSLSGNITLPASITTLAEGCFYGNAALTGVTVSSGITTIGQLTFASCATLAAVTLPASVTAIGDFAFIECPLLASVNIPASAVVGFRAFSNSGITSVTVPAGARLGDEVFMNCTRLEEADIQTLYFGYGTFTYCSALEQVTLPQNLVELPRNTFSACANLSTVNSPTPGTVALPASLAGLGDSAFASCRNITTVDMSGLSELVTINLYTFSGCTALTDVTLPPGLTQISTAAFNRCVSLAALDIPAGVTRLGIAAFMGCSALRNVTVHATQPPAITVVTMNQHLDNTFYGNHTELTFHVPAGSVQTYQTAWAALGAPFTAIE